MERLASAVSARLLPRLLCIGGAAEAPGWQTVTEPPWDGILLVSLTAAELLQMPTEPVCEALFAGKPVFVREEGLEYRRYSGRCRSLWALCSAKERQLRQWGVQPWNVPAKGQLLTLEAVRRLAAGGQSLPPGARLTPLARDFWEGRP